MTSVDNIPKSPKSSLLHYFKKLSSPKETDELVDLNSGNEIVDDFSKSVASLRDIKSDNNLTTESENHEQETKDDTGNSEKEIHQEISISESNDECCPLNVSNIMTSAEPAVSVQRTNNEDDQKENVDERSQLTAVDNESKLKTETPIRRSSRIQRKSEIEKEKVRLEILSSEKATEPRSNPKKRKPRAEIDTMDRKGKSNVSCASPETANLKIAPLFLFSKRKNRKNVIDDNDDDDDIQILDEPMKVIPSTPISEERKAFLMSGVPEILRQKQVSIADGDLIFPPFSGGTHILNLTQEEMEMKHMSKECLNCSTGIDSVEIGKNVSNFTYASERESSSVGRIVEIRNLEKTEVGKYADAIKNEVPNFPVRKYYNNLVIRKRNFRERSKTSKDSAVYDYHSLPWTDKYSASNGTAVIGKTKLVSKLKHWLNQWKKKTAIEEKTMKKDSGKKRKSTSKSRNDDDSDDDFISKLDWESELLLNDFNHLPCAFVIVGPHGCGKTSIVYALAEHLNYKVFEVNASSKRSGRHITHQLQEAMQSQHVAKDHLSSMFSTFEMMRVAKLQSAESPKPPTSSKKRKADALANFFQPKTKRTKIEEESSTINQKSQTLTQLKSRQADTADEVETEKSSGRRSRKCRENAESNTGVEEKKTKKRGRPSLRGKKTECVEEITLEELDTSTASEKSKGLTLASCSLILFDEVDVVFEEDKGFWSAIQTFVEVNKRPIILTCSDERVANEVAPGVEVCCIKPPGVTTLTGYLSAICLAEKKFIPPSDLRSLVKSFNCDFRRCLLWLQWELAFAANRFAFPSIPLSSVTADGDHILTDPLSRLPARSQTVEVEEAESKINDEVERNSSFLEVFADEKTEVEEAKGPTPVSDFSIQDSDWPKVERYGSSCLRTVAKFLDNMCASDVLRYQDGPLLTNSCDDTPREVIEKMDLGVSDMVTKTCRRITTSALDNLKEDLRNDEAILNQLPPTSVQTTEVVPSELFNYVRSSVLDALPTSARLVTKTVCKEYLPYLSSISKTEEVKRLALSKRRFFHYFDRISLNIDEDVRELLYTDFS